MKTFVRFVRFASTLCNSKYSDYHHNENIQHVQHVQHIQHVNICHPHSEPIPGNPQFVNSKLFTLNSNGGGGRKFIMEVTGGDVSVVRVPYDYQYQYQQVAKLVPYEY